MEGEKEGKEKQGLERNLSRRKIGSVRQCGRVKGRKGEGERGQVRGRGGREIWKKDRKPKEFMGLEEREGTRSEGGNVESPEGRGQEGRVEGEAG